MMIRGFRIFVLFMTFHSLLATFLCNATTTQWVEILSGYLNAPSFFQVIYGTILLNLKIRIVIDNLWEDRKPSEIKQGYLD